MILLTASLSNLLKRIDVDFDIESEAKLGVELKGECVKFSVEFNGAFDVEFDGGFDVDLMANYHDSKWPCLFCARQKDLVRGQPHGKFFGPTAVRANKNFSMGPTAIRRNGGVRGGGSPPPY